MNFSFQKINFTNGTLFSSVVLLFILNYFNSQPLDSGDGLSHFFISEASWSHPNLFLNHWGKPIFTLLSSPFALLGFKAYILFNILCFAGIVYFGQQILKELKVSQIVITLYPFLLLTIPDVAYTVLGGLTEPLFGFISITALYLAMKNKWLWFAVIISLMPFVRSEGQLIVIIAFIVLLYVRQIKYIPFLLTGFIIYGFIGLFFLEDFLWYFSNDPYVGDSNYGSGTWYHYIDNFDHHLGYFNLFFCGFSLIYLIYLLFKKSFYNKKNVVVLFSFHLFSNHYHTCLLMV